MTISGDGKQVGSGSLDSTLQIWKLDTGECVGEPLLSNHHLVSSVVTSSDRKHTVSASSGLTLQVWSMGLEELDKEPLRGHNGYVHAETISGDGKYITSGSGDETLRIWIVELGGAHGLFQIRMHRFETLLSY